MRLLRRRIRGFFMLQAILLFLALVVSLLAPSLAGSALSHLDHIAWRLIYLGFSCVFVKAWWTTRKQSPFRNLWAVAASCISLGGGLYLLWIGHSSLGLACRGLVTIIIGGTGLVLFGQGGAPANSPAEGIAQAN